MKINKIEIVFPCDVELPRGFEQVLSCLVDMVCKKYEAENKTRVMWPAGHGSKPLWREPEEPEWDDSVFSIEVAEREATEKEIKGKHRGGMEP